MSTLTAAAIADLRARRTAKGAGYAPSLDECLAAAREGRLYDVDTNVSGEDCLWIADDGDAALAEVAASVSPDDTAVPSDWSAEVVTLEPVAAYWTAYAAVEAAHPAAWAPYAAVEAAHPAAWAPYAHYDAPRPFVAALVPLADRYDLGRLARAVESAVAAEGDSESASTWATRADEWERSMADGAPAGEIDAETQGESAFRAGDGYDARRGETWCLGWAREQSAHDARIAARTTHEDAVEGRHVGCGYADCPHCAETAPSAGAHEVTS